MRSYKLSVFSQKKFAKNGRSPMESQCIAFFCLCGPKTFTSTQPVAFFPSQVKMKLKRQGARASNEKKSFIFARTVKITSKRGC